MAKTGGDLDNGILIGVQTGHFQIQPDQPVFFILLLHYFVHHPFSIAPSITMGTSDQRK